MSLNTNTIDASSVRNLQPLNWSRYSMSFV